MYSKPILLIAFNRLDTTRQVLESIRQVKPRQLFFAVDAPRLDRDEVQQCQQVRDLINEVDWDCEIKTFFPEHNLGARVGVSSAITWFFEQIEEGIILEHDCLPDLSFFSFCEEMLDRYRDDERVMHVSGNFFQPKVVGDSSYYFSKFPHIWGWATWRRAWKLYDLEMKGYGEFIRSGALQKIFANKFDQVEWKYLLDEVYYQRSNTWDFQWAYAVLKNNGFCINPNVNLVTNIGFGAGALHCKDENDKFANLSVKAMDLPINYNNVLEYDQEADSWTARNNYNFSGFKYGLARLGLLRLATKFYRLIKK